MWCRLVRARGASDWEDACPLRLECVTDPHPVIPRVYRFTNSFAGGVSCSAVGGAPRHEMGLQPRRTSLVWLLLQCAVLLLCSPALLVLGESGFDRAAALKACPLAPEKTGQVVSGMLPIGWYLPKARLVYLAIHKSASSAIITVMRELNNTEGSEHFGTLEKHPLRCGDFAPNATVFTFVREPLSRLRAAYAEVTFLGFKKHNRQRAMLQQHFNMELLSVERWAQFMRELEDPAKRALLVGGLHADPQTSYTGGAGKTCSEGGRTVPVDFVGSLDAFERDWNELLRSVNQHPSMWPLPSAHRTQDIQATTGKFAIKVAISHLKPSPFIIEQACKEYRVDYECLGFSLPRECVGNPF
jgi:hypothetical protein